MNKEYAKYLLGKTKEDYNLLAEDFSRTRSVVWEELKLLGKYISPGDKILDLGCGNGRLLQIFGEKNIEYFGVDNSEKLIKIAKEKYLHPPQVFGTQKFGRARISFQVTDALNLPFSDNFFDKVYSIAVLHHIPSTEFRLQFLKEIRRVLKPGGLLILTVWNLWQIKTAWKLLIKNTILRFFGKSKLDFKDILYPWRDPKGKVIIQRYFHLFTKRELENLCKSTGLRIKEGGSLRREKKRGANIYFIAEKFDKKEKLS